MSRQRRTTAQQQNGAGSFGADENGGGGGSDHSSSDRLVVGVSNKRSNNNNNHKSGSSGGRFAAYCAAALVLVVLYYTYYVTTHTNDEYGLTNSVWSSSAVSGVSDDNGGDDKYGSNNNNNNKQCTIWMAPSSLIGAEGPIEGYGIFTTRDMARDESILGGPDGLSVPVVQFRDYNGRKRTVPKAALKKSWVGVWDNYWWGRGVPDHVAFEAGADYIDYQILFGALPNSHCLLDSLSSKYPNPPVIDGMVDRFSSPGAGAFSYTRGREFVVDRPLQAGDEIFLNYGYCQHGNGNPDWTDFVFMPDDYKQAAMIISQKRYTIDASDNVSVRPPQGTPPIVRKILPKTVKELAAIPRTVLEETRGGGSSNNNKRQAPKNNPLVIWLAQNQGLQRRTPSWIRQHGMCLENLVPAKSTIPDAGQGAFAQFAMRKGDIVNPAPLLHVIDEDVLTIYDKKTKSQAIGKQLLLNYCFGHRASSFLVCPTTNTVLINHCSTRRPDLCPPSVRSNNGPNAAIRWATRWDPSTDRWRQHTLAEIGKEPARGLAFEYYALRDIAEGEEVTIDYGVEWEHAWDQHVGRYVPPRPPPLPEGAQWIRAQDANAKSDQGLPQQSILPFMITNSLRSPQSPSVHPYLMTGCVYQPTSEDDADEYQTPKPQWQDMSDAEILEQYADDGGRWKYESRHLKKGMAYPYAHHYDNQHYPCTVLKEEDPVTLRYTVRIHVPLWGDSTVWNDNHVPRILTNYRRQSIRYFVKPFQSDAYLPNVFRHKIAAPDGIFPPQWLDRKQTAELS